MWLTVEFKIYRMGKLIDLFTNQALLYILINLIQGRRMKIWFDGLHYLDIPKTRPSDSGAIRVIGRNRHGVVRTETQLEVLRRDDPHIQLKPTHRGIRTGVEPPETPELKQIYDQQKGHYVTVPKEATDHALCEY